MSSDVEAPSGAPATPSGWTATSTLETQSPPPSAGRALGGGLLAGAVISGVGAILLVAALVVTLLRLHDANSVTAARKDSLVAAGDFAMALSTYDFHHLDSDFAAVIDRSTGSFRNDFTKASKDLEPLITRYRATSKGAVRASGVADATTDHATVVLFVDQTVQNSNAPQPRLDRNRLRITLDRSGDRWLVSKVEIL